MRTRKGVRHGRARRTAHRSAVRQRRWELLRRRVARIEDRDELEWLQRDLEQAAADVAQRIRDLDERV